MEEKYQKFTDFDWTDERWQTYLSGLYPAPNYKQVLKFKKKWYKKNIDAEFDESYEPGQSAPTNASGGANFNPSDIRGEYSNKWTNAGLKAVVCVCVYVLGLGIGVGSMLGLCPTTQALGVLVGGFIVEILVKHGIKFSTEHLQTVVMDDVAMMPFMGVIYVAPGTHRAVPVLALVPLAITALLSLGEIFKASRVLSGLRLARAFAPLSEISTRYKLMQARADGEVMLGIFVVVGIFWKLTSPIIIFCHWNFLMMRYTVSPWTQAAFRKIDGILSPTLGRIPGVSTVYAKFKDLLYNFASSQSESRRMCSIL